MFRIQARFFCTFLIGDCLSKRKYALFFDFISREHLDFLSIVTTQQTRYRFSDIKTNRLRV